MEPVRVIHPFPPLVCPESRTLILGSFPSIKSREQRFFYGHPQNRFWRMLAAVYGEPVPEDIPAKTQLVYAHKLALWDSIGECTIIGSSDASVRDVVPVEITRVLEAAPIERVLCNGALSGRYYRRYLQPVTGIEAHIMPSTSPANAAWQLDRLVAAWREVLLHD